MVRHAIQVVSLHSLLRSNDVLVQVQTFQRKVYRRLQLLLPSTLIGEAFQVHHEDGRNFPDLQFLSGVSMDFAASAVELIIVRQLLLLGEQPQAVL